MERFVRGNAARTVTMAEQPLFWTGFLVAALLGVGLFCLLRRSAEFRSVLGASPRELHRQIAGIGGGGGSAPASSRTPGEDTVLAWVGEAQRRLSFLEAERARLTEQSRRSEDLYSLIAENCNDVIWMCALPSMKFTYVSPSVQRQRGWTPEALMAMPPGAIMSSEVERQVRTSLSQRLERLVRGDSSARFLRMEVELPHKDGHQVPVEIATTILLDERGRPTDVVGISRDISERKAAEEAVRKLAFSDPLTDLPNRRLLEDRLDQEIARAHRKSHILALLFVDLDRFKSINDQHGHATGDWLLRQVADRLHGCVRSSDTVARVGGDEFVVLVPDARTPCDAVLVAEKIRAAAAQPLVTPDGKMLDVSCSIGVALYPAQANDARTLLRRADDAMYRGKSSGGNSVWLWRRID